MKENPRILGWMEFVGDGWSWSKWQQSSGKFERLLLNEAVGSSVGYLDHGEGNQDWSGSNVSPPSILAREHGRLGARLHAAVPALRVEGWRHSFARQKDLQRAVTRCCTPLQRSPAGSAMSR